MKRFLIAVVMLFAPGLALSEGAANGLPGQSFDDEIGIYLASLDTDVRSAESMLLTVQLKANGDVFDKEGVRHSAYLAQRAVAIAHARAQQLEQAEGLTDAERARVATAAEQLNDAITSMGRLKTSLAAAPVSSKRHDEQTVRTEANLAQAHVAVARQSVDEVTYGVLVAGQ